ncbi:MAG: hypothetical protein AAF484_10900, partial [Pseudomonadota bacterium]
CIRRHHLTSMRRVTPGCPLEHRSALDTACLQLLIVPDYFSVLVFPPSFAPSGIGVHSIFPASVSQIGVV